VKRLVVAVVVLLLLLLVVDRAGAEYAARAIAADVQESTALESQPDVEVTGFPFLTQAVSGRYERIEVQATDVPADQLVLSRLDATLHGARVPLSDVLSQTVDDVPVDLVTAHALVSYDELSQSYEDRELVVEPEGDQLRVTGSVDVFDQTLSVVALSSIEVVDGDIVLSPEEVGLGEEGTGEVPTQALREQLDLTVPVQDLPYGLTVTAAEVRSDGLALRAEASDVVLNAS
jgi:hypothetical protein